VPVPADPVAARHQGGHGVAHGRVGPHDKVPVGGRVGTAERVGGRRQERDQPEQDRAGVRADPVRRTRPADRHLGPGEVDGDRTPRDPVREVVPVGAAGELVGQQEVDDLGPQIRRRRVLELRRRRVLELRGRRVLRRQLVQGQQGQPPHPVTSHSCWRKAPPRAVRS
jgi:hypothetical protein